MSLLKLKNISKRYQDFWVLKDVAFEIKRGQIFGLLGASGSGKTTLLKIIAGLIAPTTGEIFFDNNEITNLQPEKRGFGLVSQHFALSPHFTVFETVALALQTQNFSADKIGSKVAAVLSLVRLENFERRAVVELSAGEQQRVALARTLVTEPQFLLFDEPFSDLDPTSREEVRVVLHELIDKLQLTAFYITHNQDEAFALCDQIAIIEKGGILQIGTPAELYRAPLTVAAARFLGRNNLIRAAQFLSDKTSMPEFQTFKGEHRLFVDKAERSAFSSDDKAVTLMIRPENVVLPFGAAFPEDNLFKAKVVAIQYLGATTRIILDANGLQIETVVLKLVGLNVGDDCMVSLPPNRISVLND